MAKEDLKTKEIYYIAKLTATLYELRRLEIKGTKVIVDELLHTDIPNIVYGKWLQKVRLQRKENGDA